MLAVRRFRIATAGVAGRRDYRVRGAYYPVAGVAWVEVLPHGPVAIIGARMRKLQRLAVMLHHPASCANESLFGRPAQENSGVREKGRLWERDGPEVRSRPLDGQALPQAA